ncbi:anti-anti-sigma factor [Nonomuraea polychroma]|uniref:Anti-sigma factor antagonist n=1 Tax=Nonomuraea polychroma TaxID=46176 RepID=A0A438M8C7_9ACTN|nr:STAS domain-containing protein [Nonomuraea polychroma]RVX41974.1 anti-anti-sigma factor [Nonomuraea polychroma]
MTLSARMTHHADHSVVALDGELDLCSAPCLLSAVAEALAAEQRPLTIDMAGLTFCDSHGLDALREAQREITSAGSALELTHVHGRVRRVLDITGLTSAFTITPDPADCGATPRTVEAPRLNSRGRRRH